MPAVKPTDFPAIAPGNHQDTSPIDTNYNCIAFAAGDQTRWWDPWNYWPAGVPPEFTVDALTAVYGLLGYVECPTSDLEPGFDKVAIYAKPNGEATHAARQLNDGRWTSKLGQAEDVEHDSLTTVSGPLYGNPVRFMRRPWAPA